MAKPRCTRQHVSPQQREKHAGFSLVELMIALALSTFLLGGLILTYLSGRAAAADAEGLGRMQENLRFVSDHLLRDVRTAGFRDQLTLTFGQYEFIGQQFAEINNGELTVRYAGRSHCAQAVPDDSEIFNELTVVENTYFVENDRLRCSGRLIGPGLDTTGSPSTTDLVNGVSGVTFAFFPTGAPAPCNFDEDNDLETACTGVEMTLTMVGIDQNDSRDVTLRAAFRNVLVDRVYGRD